jgi:hypothetical protein
MDIVGVRAVGEALDAVDRAYAPRLRSAMRSSRIADARLPARARPLSRRSCTRRR